MEPGFASVGKAIVDLGLPNTIIIPLIERRGKFIISEGSTKICAGDKFYVMADDEKAMEKFYTCIGKQ